MKKTINDVLRIPLRGYFTNYHEFLTYESFIKHLLKGNDDFYLLGNGTNTLPIKTKIKKKTIRVKESIIKIKNDQLIVSGNVSTAYLNSILKEYDYDNFNGVSTIPGCVGAGIKGNASFLSYSFFTGLKSIVIYDKGKIDLIYVDEIKKEYRKTDIKGIILFAHYHLIKGYDLSKEKECKEKRKNQPKGIFTLGSTFKNPKGYFAFELIKNIVDGREEKFYISKQHYNFLDLKKDDKPKRIFHQLEKIRKSIKKKYNIDLEYEIKIIK